MKASKLKRTNKVTVLHTGKTGKSLKIAYGLLGEDTERER